MMINVLVNGRTMTAMFATRAHPPVCSERISCSKPVLPRNFSIKESLLVVWVRLPIRQLL